MAVVGVLVLLLVGGGVAVAILAQGDDSSSASGTSEGSGESTDAPEEEAVEDPEEERAEGPKAEVAGDLSDGLASFGTSAESFCQLFYAIGPKMIFSSTDECVEKHQSSYPLASEDREKYWVARIPESALVEVGENAYAFGDADVEFPAGRPSTEGAGTVSTIVFVVKYVDSSGGWRVVGLGMSEGDAGYFPEEARDLVLGGG